MVAWTKRPVVEMVQISIFLLPLPPLHFQFRRFKMETMTLYIFKSSLVESEAWLSFKDSDPVEKSRPPFLCVFLLDLSARLCSHCLLQGFCLGPLLQGSAVLIDSRYLSSWLFSAILNLPNLSQVTVHMPWSLNSHCGLIDLSPMPFLIILSFPCQNLSHGSALLLR